MHDPGGGGIYDPRETRHVVDINLGLLTRARHHAPARRSFRSKHVDSDAARDARAQTGGRYALLNPGAAWPNKRWPPARLAALATRAARAARPDVGRVVGTGRRGAGAARSSRRASGAAILSPQTTIADLVALARRRRVMVSGDTGPTHIAAAVGTPIVGIYGPTRPERNGPMVAARRDRVARRRLPVPSPAPLHAAIACACSTSRSPKCSPRSSAGSAAEAPRG